MLSEPVPKPFTPQEAMQWALSLGGGAKIKKGSVESEVLSVAKMPKGSYSVIGLKLGEKQPLHVVSLAALSGLADLRELTLDNNLITDAGLAFLPKLPKLAHLSLSGCGISDAGLEHLAKLHNAHSSRTRATIPSTDRACARSPGCSRSARWRSVLRRSRMSTFPPSPPLAG